MKKIFSILLIMSILILMSMNVFCQSGDLDKYGGHFVQKDGVVAVAYHYHSGVNAGWELIFNKYIKWEDRNKISLPLKPSDSTLGTWKKTEKDYKIKWLPSDPKTDPKDITWTKNVILNNKSIDVNKDYTSKNIDVTATVKGIVSIGGSNKVVYEGAIKQKLKEIGHTDVFVDAKYKSNNFVFSPTIVTDLTEKYSKQSKSYKFTFGFHTSYVINFNNNYVVLQESTPSPSSSIIPSAETSVEPSINPSTNSNKTLPKTGESSSILLIMGAVLAVIGSLIALWQLKNKILD